MLSGTSAPIFTSIAPLTFYFSLSPSPPSFSMTNTIRSEDFLVCSEELPFFSFRELLSKKENYTYFVHDKIEVRSYYFEDYFVFRTCGSYVPAVAYSYKILNENRLFPTNVTGQPFDNRIDCGPLKTKNTWEMIVTGTIPFYLGSV